MAPIPTLVFDLVSTFLVEHQLQSRRAVAEAELYGVEAEEEAAHPLLVGILAALRATCRLGPSRVATGYVAPYHPALPFVNGFCFPAPGDGE